MPSSQPHDPPAPSAVLSSGDVAAILTALTEVVSVRAPSQVGDAAIEAAAEQGPWTDRLSRACARAGLMVATRTTTTERALEGAGPAQPVVAVGVLDASVRWVVVTDRRGASVQVIDAAGSERRWTSVAELEAGLGLSPGGEASWLVVDAPLPRAEHDHPDPRRRLLAWMRLERHDLATVVVYAVFVGFLTLTTPIAVQALVNTVAFGTLLQPLVVLSLLLLGALSFAAVLRGMQFWVIEIIQRRLFVRVVADLSRRLPRVRRDALDGQNGAELVNRFFDVVTVQKAAASLLLDGLEIALTVGVGMLVLAFYHPFLFAFDLVLLASVGVVAWLGRRGGETAIEESKQKYQIAAWLEELGRHETAFKLGGGLSYAEVRADVLTRSWLVARAQHFRVVVRQFALVLALQAIAGACVLGIGGWLVIERQLTLGQLVAAELIVTVVVASVAKLGKYLEIYYDLLASMDKLGHLVDLPTERDEGVSCPPPVDSARGVALECHHLVAGYHDGPDVLNGVDLALPAGSRTALVGEDGSGKSLLVEVVAALREPRGGRVSIDGWDARALDLVSLRERIAVVRSGGILPASVLENVRMGRASVTVQRAREALATVGMLDAVDRLPEGLHTMLSSTGEPLSPGERARVVVARAIAGRPALLLIDDALDPLQPEARRAVFDALAQPERPWTLLLVSDDPKLHRRCDQVLTLKRGRVSAAHPATPAPEAA